MGWWWFLRLVNSFLAWTFISQRMNIPSIYLLRWVINNVHRRSWFTLFLLMNWTSFPSFLLLLRCMQWPSSFFGERSIIQGLGWVNAARWWASCSTLWILLVSCPVRYVIAWLAFELVLAIVMTLQIPVVRHIRWHRRNWFNKLRVFYLLIAINIQSSDNGLHLLSQYLVSHFLHVSPNWIRINIFPVRCH